MLEASLQRKLHNWQMLLLDLTRANRLLYFKVERGNSVPITSPTSTDLFHLLVTQGTPLKFPAADESALFEEEPEEEASQPSVTSSTPAGTAASTGVEALAGVADVSPATPGSPSLQRSGDGQASIPESSLTSDEPEIVQSSVVSPPAEQAADSTATLAEAGLNETTRKPRRTTLASSLSEARLTRALYNLRARSRSAAEEQGVNVLFVAFGLLHWIDPETKDEVQSPIVLVPVQLEKERGREAYALVA
jgi:hypothetical protein